MPPIIDAYQAETDAVINDMVQRPQPPRKQAPRFSLWGTLTQVPKDIAAAAAQMSASVVEALGGLSQVDISPDAMAASTPEELAKVQKRARQTLETGFRDNEVGRSLRNVARDYMPDPTTTHAAQQVVSGLVRVGSKLAATSFTLGPVAGAVALGLEEGFTHSDELAERGVDVDTRSAVGAVTAATTAATFAIPVAGKTLAETSALAAVGGPLSFMGQQAATREILARQDYTQLADQYDPFDPVGLTLATILPLGFGVLAMRGARPHPVDAPPAVAPEAVDAARTALLADQVAASRPVPAEDLAASVAHERAYEQALDQLSAGQRVEVADVAPTAGGAHIAAELQRRLAPASKAFAEYQRLNEVTRVPETQLLPSAPKPSLLAAADDIQAPVGGGEGNGALAMSDGRVSALPAEERAPGHSSAAHGIPIEDADLHARAVAIEQATPDLMVQLDGMDAPAPVGELMARLREELQQDLQEAPLLKAAAECFLMNH